MVLDFFKELFNRLMAESPLFFKIIKYTLLAISIITGLPGFLVSLGITLSPDLLTLQNKVIAIASIVGAIISTLTVDQIKYHIVGKDTGIQFVARTSKKVLSLPFSNK